MNPSLERYSRASSALMGRMIGDLPEWEWLSLLDHQPDSDQPDSVMQKSGLEIMKESSKDVKLDMIELTHAREQVGQNRDEIKGGYPKDIVSRDDERDFAQTFGLPIEFPLFNYDWNYSMALNYTSMIEYVITLIRDESDVRNRVHDPARLSREERSRHAREMPGFVRHFSPILDHLNQQYPLMEKARELRAMPRYVSEKIIPELRGLAANMLLGRTAVYDREAMLAIAARLLKDLDTWQELTDGYFGGEWHRSYFFVGIVRNFNTKRRLMPSSYKIAKEAALKFEKKLIESYVSPYEIGLLYALTTSMIKCSKEFIAKFTDKTIGELIAKGRIREERRVVNTSVPDRGYAPKFDHRTLSALVYNSMMKNPTDILYDEKKREDYMRTVSHIDSPSFIVNTYTDVIKLSTEVMKKTLGDQHGMKIFGAMIGREQEWTSAMTEVENMIQKYDPQSVYRRGAEKVYTDLMLVIDAIRPALFQIFQDAQLLERVEESVFKSLLKNLLNYNNTRTILYEPVISDLMTYYWAAASQEMYAINEHVRQNIGPQRAKLRLRFSNKPKELEHEMSKTITEINRLMGQFSKNGKEMPTLSDQLREDYLSLYWSQIEKGEPNYVLHALKRVARDMLLRRFEKETRFIRADDPRIGLVFVQESFHEAIEGEKKRLANVVETASEAYDQYLPLAEKIQPKIERLNMLIQVSSNQRRLENIRDRAKALVTHYVSFYANPYESRFLMSMIRDVTNLGSDMLERFEKQVIEHWMQMGYYPMRSE